jgi:protein phosphatase
MKYLVISDVHANAAALDAVLENESWDRVLFLGDAVDAGPHPNEVVSTLSGLRGRFLVGNHDRYVLGVDPEAEPETHDEAWCQWTRDVLTEENVAFLRGLSESQAIEAGGRQIRLHHGDFPADWNGPEWNGRLWPDADDELFSRAANAFEEPVVLHGHSHIQFEATVDGKTFWNPGSVGQTRLGDVVACYATITDGEIRFKSVEYDAGRTCDAMDTLPLDDEYVEARKRVYTEGRLPNGGGLRDFAPLEAAGYR